MSGPSRRYDSPTQRPSAWAPEAAPFGSTETDFHTWISWANHTYELDLPHCWPQHPGLVHTLGALWHLWRAVYATPPGIDGYPAPGGVAQWHLAYLLPLRDRLQRPDGAPGASCRTKGHRDHAGKS